MTPELRLAARALVLDASDRVLLVRFEHQGSTWWAAPGGGLEAGETHEQALRRELVEEVGVRVADDIGPCVWIREHTFPWLDRVIRQRERYHLLRLSAPPGAPALGEELRLEGIVATRWWTLEELAASSEVFAPRGLPAALRRLVDDGPPAEPIDVGV